MSQEFISKENLSEFTEVMKRQGISLNDEKLSDLLSQDGRITLDNLLLTDYLSFMQNVVKGGK